MKERFLHRITLATVWVMTGFFGFPGLVAADARISHTGPDSYNKIEHENEDKCIVDINNDVNVLNKNSQNARTGDAVVGSQWGKYAPEAWQARGQSYEEWHAAVSAHMSEYEGKWGKHSSGGGNTYGGHATTGDATNVNDTSTNVSIDNSDACAEFILVDVDGDGKPDKKVAKKSGHVLGKTSPHGKKGAHGPGAGAGAGGHVLGVSGGIHGVGGQGGVGGAFHPKVSGGQKGGDGKVCDCPGGHDASISHTGPDSYNKVNFSDSNKVNVTTTNNVNVTNYSKQTAVTGDATVSGNTSGGRGGTGGAYNGNDTGTGANLSN